MSEPIAIQIISDRIVRMRDVYASGSDPDGWMSAAFHLMEVQCILEGKYTCGVYDDYGAPEGKKAGDKR